MNWYSILIYFKRFQSFFSSLISLTSTWASLYPLSTLSYWEPWKGPIWIGLTVIVTVINDLLLFNRFQHSVVFHIEVAIWFALQIMLGFYVECYIGLKWVKREYALPQILNLSLSKCFLGSFISMTRNSSENPKPFWRQRFGRKSIVCLPSNGEELRYIQHSMDMVVDTRFHI